MFLNGSGVPDARIVHDEGNAHFLSRIAPDAQGILYNAGGRDPHLRRIAGIAGMALAIALNKIGLDFFKLLDQSLLCYVPAQDSIRSLA